MISILDLPKSSNECSGDTVLTHGQEHLFRKVTPVSIHSLVEWLDTFSKIMIFTSR
jgi:hypothetical protein